MQKIISFTILALLLSQISYTNAQVSCSINQYYEGGICKNCHFSRQSNAGSTSVTDCICKAGYASTLNDNSGCIVCDFGTFSAAGAQTCSECHICRTTNGPFKTKVSDCISKAGYSSNVYDNSGCIVCDFGTFSGIGAQTCTDCHPTRTTFEPFRTKVSDCICQAGYYSSKFDNSECTQCPVGTFSDLGATSCTPCEATRTTRDIGNTSPAQCICKIGFYSNFYNNSRCSQCDPTRTTSVAGKNLISDCICKEGYTSIKNDNSPCTPL